MTLASLLERIFKYLFLLGACAAGIVHFQKDDWPEPDYYDPDLLGPPLQTAMEREPFSIEANRLRYTIRPKFSYELYGMVVSYSNADGFTNIWHHRSWQDFINVRDLCVIWGKNVASGVYQRMEFSSDSWTCWAYWPDQATGAEFSMTELSNNHLVTGDDTIKATLMEAEPGDLIRFKGMLAEYVNQTAGYTRGTSTRRDDTGQGACETVYVEEFEIVQKANPGLRKLAAALNGLTLLSLVGFVAMFLIAPAKRPYR